MKNTLNTKSLYYKTQSFSLKEVKRVYKHKTCAQKFFLFPLARKNFFISISIVT